MDINKAQKKQEFLEQEVDFIDLIYYLLSKWKLLIIISICSSVLIYSILMFVPESYKSKAVLTPQQSNPAIANLGALGGIASLSGINLGGENKKVEVALAFLTSKNFLYNFLQPNDYRKFIWAAKGWDSNTVVYNNDIYNTHTDSWVEGFEPTQLQVYDKFIEDHLVINQDKTGTFITLEIKHYSPIVARDLLVSLLSEMNKFLSEKEVSEATKSIEYYKQRLKEQNVETLNRVLYSLIEEEEKRRMLALTSDSPIFQVIDPPSLAEFPYFPKKKTFTVVGVFVLLICTCFILSFGFVFRTLKQSRVYKIKSVNK
ncbi:Wzz/FepE/Etk N-terminal domain-containing protein [Pseudoalteromonas phenolica]|uniref:Wzz/FepE/Etk N-terminal domain-containing protein n=1 Tax=Pseudoalteromonas phenolica TaxID=161398 RepID=UPI0014862857|nr:Wzz/FepE/Etk N-terminal domain-containing protein [Pseudoalteromonas phenolica]